MAYVPYKLIRQVKERDDGCCVLCGNPESWVNQIDDKSEIRVQNLITLCRDCYPQRKGEEIRRYIKSCYKGAK